MHKHMEYTKQICHQELDHLSFKYESHHVKLIFQFLWKDLKSYFLWACLGLVISISITLLIKQSLLICVSGYFMFLGLLSLYEHVKNERYQVSELLVPVYLNSGRRFLYKMLCISFLQVIYVIGICLLLPLELQEITQILLCSLLPIYLSQMISLWFMEWIASMGGYFIIFVLSYLSVIVFLEFSELLYTMYFSQTLGVVMVLTLVYVFNIFMLAYQRKEKTYGIGFRKYG